jgi:RNA 3'-terminal phosphate cyclase
MNVSLRIDYIASSRVSQSGSFPLRGRRPEKVALEWWKELKKETSYRAALEKVTADGEEITQLVKDLEEEELNNALNDDLPF